MATRQEQSQERPAKIAAQGRSTPTCYHYGDKVENWPVDGSKAGLEEKLGGEVGCSGRDESHEGCEAGELPIGRYYGGRAVDLPFDGTKAGAEQMKGHNAGVDAKLGQKMAVG